MKKNFIIKNLRLLAVLTLGYTTVQAQELTPDKEQGQREGRTFAVTEYSVNYLRQSPDYESPLETQELMGTPAEVVDSSGYWRLVNVPQPYTAWCTDKGLVYMSETELNDYIAAPKYIYTSAYGHVFSGPSEQSGHICDIVAGDLVRIAYRKDRPITKGRWAGVFLPSGRLGYVEREHVENFAEWAQNSRADKESIIATALTFAGTPYLWGGMSVKGLDCSGLTRLSWFLNGVLLPRNASQQVHTGDEVVVDYDYNYTAGSEGLRDEMIKRTANLKAGDLVFFGTPAQNGKKEKITHVGLYIGNNRIIHSSHHVRINSLIPGENDYYENSHRLIKARRILGMEDCGKGIISIKNSPSYF